MEIHILLAGEELGPFSEAQVRQYLEEGLVSLSDLVKYEGMEDWQPLDFVLANLPPAEPPPEPSAPAPADPAPSLTASQQTKRGKIVIQAINPLEATAPGRDKAWTGKTALALESLRPTTSLPSATGLPPRAKKSGKTLVRTTQLSLLGLAGKPVATSPATPPTAPVPPPAPSNGSQPTPPKNATGTPDAQARSQPVPHAVAYACVLACLIYGLIFSCSYLISAHRQTPPAASPVNPENVPPSPNQVETPSPKAVPKTAADYRDRGLARQSKGNLDGAILDYNQALDLDPKDVEAFYQRGLARQTQGDMSGALSDYNQVLDLDPKQADAYSNRGFVKQAQGDPDGALADYAQALLINPKIPFAYYNEGLIEVQKGDLDGAIASYDHALDLDPKMAAAYYHRGNVKNTEGNLDGAIADYTQALALNPKIASAYCDRGFARQSKGDSDGALADYAKALALDPKMAAAFYNRGLIKVQKGDLDGAVADNTQVIDLDPKNGQAYCNRGLARLGKGNLDGAQADLRKFCELLPRDSGADAARLYLWVISTEENPKGNADQELSTSLQNDWNSPPEDLTSKIAAFLLGHINENDFIANAASPDPSREPGRYCKAWYFAGMKRLLAGDTTTAINYFHKSVATEQKDFCDYIFAQAELQALDQRRETSPKPESSP